LATTEMIDWLQL